MVTLVKILKPPLKSELEFFKKGLVLKIAILVAIAVIVHIQNGAMNLLWYPAAFAMSYLVLMIGVIEHRLENQNGDQK